MHPWFFTIVAVDEKDLNEQLASKMRDLNCPRILAAAQSQGNQTGGKIGLCLTVFYEKRG